MYNGSIDHGKIISAVLRSVPDTYVRDYRDNQGFITICRGYKDIPWRDQTTTRRTYRQVPHITLMSLPRGSVTASTIYHGLRLHRTGWREQFRRASRHLSREQQRRISRELALGEVFEGVR